MNGIKEPTQFELHYECYQNYFLLYPLHGDDEKSTESDRVAEESLQEICNFARDYDNVNSQREQGIEEAKAQHPVCGANEVDHYTWKQKCSRKFAAGESCLVRNLSLFIKKIITINYIYSHHYITLFYFELTHENSHT
jgi:hypothetical protein